MTLFYSFLSAIIFLFIFTYLPVTLIFHKQKLNFSWDTKLNLGIALLGVWLLFSRLLLSTHLSLFIYLTLISLLAYKTYRVRPCRLNLPKFNYWLIGIITIGVLIQAAPFVKSGIEGLEFTQNYIYSSHDQAWHQALIRELSHQFPPQTPGYSGTTLTNYHFLYDLIVQANWTLFNTNLEFLLQVIYPIIISALFGLSIFRLSSRLIKSKFIIYVSTFLGYTINNLSYFFNQLPHHSNTFILDQPAIFLYNQQTVLSISLVISLSLIIQSIVKSKKIKLETYLIASIGVASLAILKFYAFIIFTLSMGVLGAIHLYRYLVKKSYLSLNFIKLTFLSGLASLSLVLTFFKVSNSKFIDFNPGWILTIFFDRVVNPVSAKFSGYWMIYQTSHNPKIIILYLILLIIFLIGNFHWRLIGFIYLFKKSSFLHRFIALISLLSLVGVLIGNQSVSAHNIIQFAPYATVLLIPLSLSLVESSIKNKQAQNYLAILMLVISLPVTLINFSSSWQSNQDRLNYELIGLLKLSQPYPHKNLISLIEADTNGSIKSSNLIGAVADKTAYLSDFTQLTDVFQIDYQERLAFSKQARKSFCSLDKSAQNRLTQEGIGYILAPRSIIGKTCGGNGYTLKVLEQTPQYIFFKYEQTL